VFIAMEMKPLFARGSWTRRLLFATVVALAVVYLGSVLGEVLFKNAVERLGSRITGTAVEIGDLDINWWTGRVTIQGFHLIDPHDPWQDLFEAERVTFIVSLRHLYRRKIEVGKIEAVGAAIHTRRRRKASRPSRQALPLPDWLIEARRDLLAQASAVSLFRRRHAPTLAESLDSLLAAADLPIFHRIDRLRDEADSVRAKARRAFAPLPELHRVERRIDLLVSAAERRATDGASTLAALDSLEQRVETIREELQASRKRAEGRLEDLSRRLSGLEAPTRVDVDGLLQSWGGGIFSPHSLAKAIFGRTAVRSALKLVEYEAMALTFMPPPDGLTLDSRDQAVRQVATSGQDGRILPKLEVLVLGIKVRGRALDENQPEMAPIHGSIGILSNRPADTGRPIAFRLEARNPRPEAYFVRGTIDHTTGVVLDQAEFMASGVRFGRYDLAGGDYLPAQLVAERGKLSGGLTFFGDSLALRFSFTARPADFVYDQGWRPRDELAEQLRSEFAGIEGLQLYGSITGPPERLKLEIDSSIDDGVALAVRRGMRAWLTKRPRLIAQRLQTVTQSRKADALRFIRSCRSDLDLAVQGPLQAVDRLLTKIREERSRLR